MPRETDIIKKRIETAAVSILHIRKELVDNTKDEWDRQGEKQAYLDAIHSMVHSHLITDYNVLNCTVTVAEDIP